MAKNWKKIAAPLTLAFAAAIGLAGCDSQADIDAKPQVMQQMVQNSVSVCAPAQGAAAAYSARLNDALDHAGAGDLRILKDNHMTICLDQRLNNQTTGFWDKPAQGVMTRDADGKGGTITIWDNGTQPEDGGFFHRTAGTYSHYILHTFASHLGDGDVQPGARWIAYDSSYYDGNTTIQDSSAKPEANFDKDTRAKNPWLQEAPVVKPAPQAAQPKGPGA